MPRFTAEQLHTIAGKLLQGAGVDPAEAATIASELVDANLVGHDSHGVMRVLQYVDSIERGFIRPGGAFEIVQETPSLLIVDGHFNFGQVTAGKALRLGMEKARSGGTATVMLRNCNHIGRLGSYTQHAAGDGFACLMGVNAPGPGGVAPYGGKERRLGTNPISLAAPGHEAPLVLDMTTSAVAEGKIRVAFQKGEPVPEGWIIDADGRPTTDPAALYANPPGALLPLGGLLGFKGFGMAVMLDVFCGILSGSGVCRTDLPAGANGVWIYLLDIRQFLPEEQYQALIERYVATLKATPKLPGVDEILLPGEIENRRRQERLRDGIPIPEKTWELLQALAAKLGVAL
jgi:uncharacterized oxidoreductase